MIQIDTNSPELGQVVSQDLRNNRADKNGEGSAEFAQIWSEFSEPDSSEITAQVDIKVSIAKQNDRVATDETSDLDVEDAEVLSIPHPVEIKLSASERTQTTQPPVDGPHTLQAKTLSNPRSLPLPETPQVLAGGLTSELAELDTPVSPEIGEQLVAPALRSETAAVTPTVNPINLSTPPPHSESSAAKSIAPHTALVSSATASADMLLAPENGTKAEQSQQKLGVDQASLQTIASDQHNNVRSPTEGAIKRAVQVTETAARARGQVTAPTDTIADRVPAPNATQAPQQSATQTLTIPNSAELPSQEWPLAPQSVAKPNPSISSMELPNLSKTEPLFPISVGVLEAEVASPQTLQVSSANVSTVTTSASQSISSKVTLQVAAAIFQSSNSTTEILLNPEELGRVRISLTNGEAGMTVNILSERLETTDLMRRNIELLARELREMGYENPSFTFGEQSSGSNDPWEDDDQESPPENLIQLPEPPTPSIQVTLTGGLDLKL